MATKTSSRYFSCPDCDWAMKRLGTYGSGGCIEVTFMPTRLTFM